MSEYVFRVSCGTDFKRAIERVTEALKAEGFGVLSTIDVAATLKTKLGVDRRPYVILGACNPHYAHQALEAEPDIGALLPCNVVVRTEDDGTQSVVFMDPSAVLGLINRAEVDTLGSEVRAKLERVAEAVAE